MQEFAFWASAKNEQKMSSFNCIFQGFWPYFRISYTLEEIFLSNVRFCKTPLSSGYCILCSLWARNSKFSNFLNIFIFLHHTITNAIICLRRPRRLTILHYTDIGTSLSCHYVVSNFLRTLLNTSVTSKTRNIIFAF